MSHLTNTEKNENNKIEKDLQEEISKCLKTSEDLDKIIKKIYKTVELTKINATDKFMSFIEPKKNLDEIALFYDVFNESDNKLEEFKNFNIEITNLDQAVDCLEKCNMLWKIKDDLCKYEKILIAKKVIKENEELLKIMMRKIEIEFFNNLWINKDTIKLNKIVSFVLEKSDNKEFLSKYSSELFNKVSFKDIAFDKSKLLKKTEDLDEYLYNINIYNLKVLGEINGRGINIGLNKILVINLTKIISDNLQVVERAEKLEDVSFLMELNYNLKHSNEKRIKDIESLFVFKDPINKIICNIFITFCDLVERLDKPNKYCDVEILALHLRRALDSMNKYKILTNVFLRNYGPMFKIKTLDECNELFTSLLIKKIRRFSESLPDLKKFIYLINNLYTLQNFIKSDLKDKISVYSDLIKSTFKKEIEKRNKDKITSFINSNISAFKSYYLPDDIRNDVVIDIKKVIWEEIAKKDFTGNIDTLNESINEMFTGQ